MEGINKIMEKKSLWWKLIQITWKVFRQNLSVVEKRVFIDIDFAKKKKKKELIYINCWGLFVYFTFQLRMSLFPR